MTWREMRMLATSGMLLTLAASARPAAAAPATTLVMPFDATPGSVSFLVASHPRAASAPAGVRTHWAFWDDGCTLLADAIVCLPGDGSVVVDPSSIPGAAPPLDLSGRRGFVTVTAYTVAGTCDPTSGGRGALALDGLIGSFTLADVGTGASFAGAALALPADATGAFADLPGDPAAGDYESALRLQTFDPARLDLSRVILLALRERAGSGVFRTAEPGPAVDGTEQVRAGLRFAAQDGTSVALADASLGCATFTSLRRDDVPTLLVPDGAGDAITSGGFLALEDPRIGDQPLGGTTFLLGFHAQAVGSFGALAAGDAVLASHSQPTPGATSSPARPTPSPRPSPTPHATATPGGPPTPLPTSSSVAATSTPIVAPTTTPAGTPTVIASSSPHPSPTPGSQPTTTAGTATPAITATPGKTPGTTPGGTATPGTTASPRPTSSAAATPVTTASPARTPAPTSSPAPATATPPPTGCTTLTVQVRTTYGASAPSDVSGVIATVKYPAALAIPGSGSEPSVAGRVTNLSGVNGLFQATDADVQIRIGLVSVSAAIPQGALARVVFDCASGTAPPASALGCTLDASTLDGTLVTGAACTTEILP